MKNTLTKFFLFVVLAFASGQVFAVDLVKVYQQALNNDPTFKMAHASWLSYRENIAISRAGLLPSFSIQGNLGRNFNNLEDAQASPASTYKTKYNNNTLGYQLSLTQPIFNYKNWALLSQAKASEKEYAAQYSAAMQDLIYRTVSAYFNVLKARDILHYTVAECQALKSELNRTLERYRVGLSTLTEVEQARAGYDGVVAQKIQDTNNLKIQEEKLREITNREYKTFSYLGKNLPLVYPNPKNIQKWTDVAQTQNYSLRAARFAKQAAKENIKVQMSGHLPVLNATGQYSYTHNNNTSGSNIATHDSTALLGLTLSLPVFEGGAVTASTRQAQYNYQYASENLNKVNRSVVSAVAQAYLNVIAGINVIKAQKQSVISAKRALLSTLAAYKVGTQTMTDVLSQESNLYNALKNYSNAQYDYLIATVALKQSVGTLGLNDVKYINSLLSLNSNLIKVKENYRRFNAIKRKIPIKITKTKNGEYGIQLIATKNIKGINNFIKKHKLANNNLSIFQICKNNKHLYLLLVGSYSSLDKAKAESQKLKLNKYMKNIHPWIRKYADITSLCKYNKNK